MTSILDLRDRLMPRLPAAVTPPPAELEREEARASTPVLVVAGEEKLTVTVPATRERAQAMSERLFVKLTGKLVEAEKANRNGAFWTAQDLEVGLPTVANGPLNWLHEEKKIVGCLTDARMVTREAAAAEGSNPYLASDAVMWRWLYPRETAMVERYADERKLWYSMECISPEVACVGPGGCGKQVPYVDALMRTGQACGHMRERSAARRFVDPIFQGAGIIIPPTVPGWASADLTVQRQTAAYLETDETSKVMVDGLKEEEAVAMVQQVMEYASSK